jgi:hypothetical protein
MAIFGASLDRALLGRLVRAPFERFLVEVAVTAKPRGVVKMTFRLADEIVAVRKLMTRYANVPMALADACLVRMTEIETKATVLTLDADFRVYRRHGRQVIPVLLPDR